MEDLIVKEKMRGSGIGFALYSEIIAQGKRDNVRRIEVAQIFVVILSLLLAYIIQTLFKFSKRDWTLTVSAFIVGVVIPILLQNEIWHK